MSQNKGFTMIEIIFTLSIILILSSFTLYNTKKEVKVSYQNVKHNISNIIDEAKDTALTQHIQINLEFNYNKISYTYNNKTYRYVLPHEYSFEHIEKVYFNQNGSINQANHINLLFHDKVYSIVFHLGAGDYYFKE